MGTPGSDVDTRQAASDGTQERKDTWVDHGFPLSVLLLEDYDVACSQNTAINIRAATLCSKAGF